MCYSRGRRRGRDGDRRARSDSARTAASFTNSCPTSGRVRLVQFYADRGLAFEDTAFDGRSDYEAFALANIPAGGLFTGAEGIKTPAQVALYGGTARVAYDPNYHQAGDDLDNVSLTCSTRTRTRSPSRR
ncbi:MAG: M28 family peptidase [Pseudonocardia sp.]|nr:M28 family peptidase [Pseudonocardia sp.]